MQQVKYIKGQCSKVSQTKKVKCPKKEKKEEETKYTLAFHAEGKNEYLCTDIFGFYLVSLFGKPIIVKGGAECQNFQCNQQYGTFDCSQ